MQPTIDLLGLSLKTFGLMFAFGFLAAGAIIRRRLVELTKPEDWAYEITFSALVGGLVGARLYYVIQHTGELTDDPLSTLFGGSGLVWYGGALGGAVGVLLWGRRRGMLDLRLLDLCSVSLALGYAIGRIGCQLSGDGDYGKPWDGPWAMAYPKGTVPTDVTVHPTPIYETVSMTLLAWVCGATATGCAPVCCSPRTSPEQGSSASSWSSCAATPRTSPGSPPRRSRAW